MLKKLMLFTIVISMVAVASAADINYLKPHRVTNGDQLDELDEFFLNRMSDNSTEYYLGSGSAGDTMAVHFHPLAPCSVKYAEIQWYSAGPYQAFMWDYTDAAQALYPDGRAPARGTSPESPLGMTYFGPYPTASNGDQDWELMFDESNTGGIWLPEGEDFLVGFVKTTDDGLPQPLADDISARGFAYTWFGGPWNDGADYPWGGYSPTVVEIAMRVAVTYPLGAPPIIGNMNQLPNTVNGSKTVMVETTIEDDNGWGAGDSAELYVQKNADTPMSYELIEDPLVENRFYVEFTLDGAAGDTYAYWVQATDDEGGVNSNEDNQLSFEVIAQPYTWADMLVIDHGSDTQDQLIQMLNDQGWAYSFYDVTANKGIDEFLLSMYDWGSVFVFGWGSNSVPTRDDDNAYAAWLADGGNIFFSDMDYFYANGEDAEPDFVAGDFAYDFLGLDAGVNDPVPTDSSFYATDDTDPVAGPFFDEPFAIFPNTWSGDWADFITPRPEATAIFEGADTGELMGLRWDRPDGGKTVYLSFDVMAAIDIADTTATDQFVTLMGNTVTYFGVDVGVDDAPEVAQPMTYSLQQNYPNPFNPSTQIAFTLPVRSDARLTVYNVAGQEVATLVDETMNAGQHNVTFDASSLSSGVYFYKLQAGDFTATQKMVLMK